MQLGKALVGGIIGAVLGIAALIAVQWFTGWDRYWLAILVAIITGLGVRSTVSTHGHASYLRGALTALLALAAFAAGTYLYSEIAKKKAVALTKAPAAHAAANSEEVDATDGEAEVAPVDEADAKALERPRVGGAIGQQPRLPQKFSPWDFAWLTIAALIAYELGRGTSAPAVPQQEVVPPPDAT